MKRAKILSIFVSSALIVLLPGLFSVIYAAKNPVNNIHFEITTSPQRTYSMRVTVNPKSGLGSESSSPEIALPDGFVFLLVKINHGVSRKSATGGVDVYLIDGGGEKNSGYCQFMNYTWMVYEGAKIIGGDEFLYVVKRDRVPGSVFHYFGKEYKVSMDTE